MEHQAHGTGEKKGIMDKIKAKLPGGHGDHQKTAGAHGQQGHTGTGAHVAPATGDTYGQQGHAGTRIHGADTGEKKGVKENIKDKLPGGHGDHQQTGGTYGQQGHTGTGTYDTPAIDDTYGDQGHSGYTGTGIHGADTGEKKGVKENIKDKLPGGHGDHQQTGGTYGQQGHTGTGTYDTPAIDDTYGEQSHTGHTDARIHGADTGEKKGVKENIKDKLPGGHGDHQQTGGTYGQQGHAGTGTYDTPAIDDTYGEQGHTGHTGAGMHGVDTSEKKGIMEDIKEKSPGGHDEHQQVGDTYGQQGHVGTGTHGMSTTSSTYGQQGHTGAGMHDADTGEKKGVMENIKDELPGGHQQTGGTYQPQEDTEMTGMGTHSTPATDGTYEQQGHAGMTGTGAHSTDEKNGVMGNIKEKLPEGHADHQQTAGTYGQQDHAGMRTHATLAYDETYGQQGHTGMTGTETHDTDEKKGVMENIKEKLPGGHADHQQTTGTYGQQDHVGTGTHATLTSDDTYGQQGHTGVTGTGTHDTDEKKGAMENIKEKLPSGHADHQQTAGTYGQQGHVGTGTHGTPATDGTYGQHAHTGVTDTTHITDNTGDKKGAIENIKEKLPGGHDDHQQTTDTYGQHGHNGMTDTETHGTTATGGTYGQPGHTATTGTGTHGTDGIGEKKSLMDKIKEKLPGQH